MPENLLKHETSPYLLQHQANPVHWRAWGPEALAEAKQTGKPILLSVGYAACHWCHVMAHESFEDPATAEVMNELYVNIKVDREERPDIDAIYMTALHALGEQGGWPLTMFLDSEAQPFFGGTYFPRQAQYGRPAFVTVLLQIAEIYRNEPQKVRNNVDGLMAALNRTLPVREGVRADDGLVRHLLARLVQASDPVHGGLGGAPKFPQWNVLWLMWRGAIRFQDQAARDAVITALMHMCQGGIYDHLGGGFARYSVDERWLVPHFEKMLYDNALLIDLLTEVWRETREPLFAVRVSETVAWLQREMTTEGGGLAASLDADSEGEEGKFYVWSPAEIRDVLGDSDGREFCATYDVTPEGNFEGHSILNRLNRLALLSPSGEARLAQMRAKLLLRRERRIRPGLDDKVLADWNGLAVAALVRAGVTFERPEWIDAARSAFGFVTQQMSRDGGRLWHSARSGKRSAPATAADYAAMTWGALRLYQATGEHRYLVLAQQWTGVLDQHHWDERQGGYFTAADDTQDVIVRLKAVHDDAVPSANALALMNLLALAALTGEAAYQTRAELLFTALQADIFSSPAGHCGLLASGLDVAGVMQIVLMGAGRGAEELRQVIQHVSLPNALELLAQSPSRRVPPTGADQAPGDLDRPTVYLCRGPVCELPITDPATLAQRLNQARQSTEA